MHESRRSSRIPLAIPIEVSGLDATGAEFREKATTKVLSRYGACIVVKHRLLVGTEVRVSIPSARRDQTARVVWVNSDSEPFETGVELDAAEHFWGVQFPPEDWVDGPKEPLPLPLAGNDEQQIVTVAMMLNALIAVLQEKGIVTKAELAETLKRLE